MATPTVRFVGNFEERRFAGYSEYGTKTWTYPTVIYKRIGWDGPSDLPLYEYDRTDPA